MQEIFEVDLNENTCTECHELSHSLIFEIILLTTPVFIEILSSNT